MEELIQQLRDPNPRRRVAAITSLAKTKDPRVMKPLWNVYQNDPHPEVRKAAYQAGRYIRRQMEEEKESSDFSWSGGTKPPPKEEPPPNPKDPEVSARDQQRARSFLDRAITYHMNQNQGRAAEFLVKAVQTDPGIKKDTIAIGLASELTKRPAEEAFALLLNSSIVDEMTQRSQQRLSQKKRVEVAEDMSIATTYVLMYWVVSTVGMFLFMFMALQFFSKNIGYVLPTDNRSIISNLKQLSIVAALLMAGIWGVTNTVSLIFQTGTIHFVARYVFVGSGNYWGFLRRIALFYVIVLVLFFAFYIVLLGTADPRVFFFSIVAATFGGFYSLYYLTRLIADYYGFGLVGGCLSIVGGAIVAAVLTTGISIVLTLLAEAL